MERLKIMLNDKSTRLQMAVILICLCVLIIAGQLIVSQITKDYKSEMIEHDCEVAGYLSQNGLDKNLIIAAFTSDKSTEDAETGSVLLSSAGYSKDMRDSLLSKTIGFHQKHSIIVLIFSILISALLFAIQYRGLLKREAQLKTAGLQLRHFLDGDISVRLEDNGEGALYRLFSAVNAMATSLTAHIEKEKNNKQFLKDTISDISHQLKTPLAALQIYNEIIVDEKSENEVVECFVLKSRRELERMENLIQSLLKLARLDAEAIELELKMHDLRSFLQNIIGDYLVRAELNNVSISLECDENTMFSFDEIWLGEAVGNIIKNALDHTSAGNSIKILCTDTVAAIDITIRDTGSGIHPEDLYHVFKRFYRSRFSKDKQGVGIGLSLSKAIVEKHGGTITVQSEYGQGTSFNLIFPKLTNL